MIVDGDADVVFLDEFFDARKRLRSGVAGDDDGEAGTLGVFEFGAEVGVVIFVEGDGAGGVELNFGAGVVGECGGFGFGG